MLRMGTYSKILNFTKQAVRIICLAHKFTHTELILKEFHILKLSVLKNLSFIPKLFHNPLNTCLQEILQFNNTEQGSINYNPHFIHSNTSFDQSTLYKFK